jgi:hypothetical protein
VTTISVIEELVQAALGAMPSKAGVEIGEVARAEARLGFGLPAELRAFYASVGCLKAVMDSFHVFVPIQSIVLAHEAISFCRDHQGGAEWAILKADCSAPDPPVRYGFASRKDWAEQTQPSTRFLTNMTCWQLLNSMPAMGWVKLEAGTITGLRRHTRVVGAAFGSDMISFVNVERGVLGSALLNIDRLYLASRSDTLLQEFESRVGLELDWC